ncbi:MAG TPA: NHL repeat-containing protein, partial [Candidatus Ozemobacteraceae bacterium]|nr:NHL repeat-containing protein [Candidatus Ozemobacteraceae bacterium]
KPDMPPFGSSDGIEFRGQPWRLSVNIPQVKIASASGSIEATLRVSISGSNAPIDVVRSTLSFTGPTQSAAFGSSLPQTAQRLLTTVSTKTEEIPLAAAPASAAAVPPAELVAASQPLQTATSSAAMPAMPTTPAAPVETGILEATESVAVPAVPAMPAMTPVSLPTIVPCADPGTNATLSVMKKFSVGEGGPNDAFSWPKGLTWSSDGTLWVVDSQNRRLLRFLDDGRLLTALGKKGRGPGMLGLPIDISVASSGIFVSDTAAHAVHYFDAEGSFIRTIGAWGTKTGQLDLPHGVFADGDQVWVTDRGNMKVMRFGLDGIYRGGFGKKGEMEGYITEPVSIKIFKDVIWILEGKSGRIQRFSREGKALGSFPSGAKEPLALEIDPWGCPWIADGDGHRLMRFDPSGRMLMTIQPPAGGRQWIPTSVSVRVDGIVAVGDGEDRSIHLYRIKKP